MALGALEVSEEEQGEHKGKEGHRSNGKILTDRSKGRHGTFREQRREET
jgi:hypothetical protein